MDKIAALLIAAAMLAAHPAHAQDIAGIEDCSKTSGLDKRTGCFQSNVEFLHRLLVKNSTGLQQKLSAATAEIGELKRAAAGLQSKLGELQSALAKLQSGVEQLQQGAKKTETK